MVSLLPINVGVNQLWEGCIMAGIAHAIGVSKYPMLSNEQSWDGINYSMQDSLGQRGTITFGKDFCVAVFRNENSVQCRNGLETMSYFAGAPEKVIQLAKNEALQYLLEEVNGKVIPIITTAFWGGNTLFSNDLFEDIMKKGGNLLKNQLLDEKTALYAWEKEYDMTKEQRELLEKLFMKKKSQPYQPIILPTKDLSILKVSVEGFKECKESFKEMNILLIE